jgi:hypothetical protein
MVTLAKYILYVPKAHKLRLKLHAQFINLQAFKYACLALYIALCFVLKMAEAW